MDGWMVLIGWVSRFADIPKIYGLLQDDQVSK